jgi:hypothetical protein
MSQTIVEQIIGKMLLDREFRGLMTSNIEKALAGYDLTEDEIKGLKNLDMNDFHQTVTGLDQRVSKGQGWN